MHVLVADYQKELSKIKPVGFICILLTNEMTV